MSQLDVTSANETTGAGVIDSWHSFASSIESIKNAHGADKAAVAVEVGVTGASAVLDTVAFALDPLAKLISAGLGWLIEHVEFLRWPLDQIAGNPDAIQDLANQLHTIGQRLRNAATDFDNALTKDVTNWKGQAADQFTATMNGHRTHIDDAGHSVDTVGYVVETTMALIAAVRGLFRDIITTVLGDIIATMLVALAAAVFTFGASIAVGVTKCVVEATVQVSSMMAKLAKVGALASRTASRIGELTDMTRGEGAATHDAPTPHTSAEEPVGDPDANDYSAQADILDHYHNEPGEDDYSAQQDILDDYHNAPADDAGSTHTSGAGGTPEPPAPASPHDEPAPVNQQHEEPTTEPPDEQAPAAPPKPADPKSLLKDQDISLLKKHEDWLKNNFKESQAKAKFVDNWVKNHAPDSYPLVKAMADAKSSKNWVGWVDKSAVAVDKQLTDIQQQAEAAWQQANQQQPDQQPAAT